ncbi:YciI family protein [Ralstonia nicotianae]
MRYNVANPFPPHRKSKSVPISAWMFVVRTQRIWQREPGHFSGLRVAGTAVPLRYAAAAGRAGPVPGRRAAFWGAAEAMGSAACGASALARVRQARPRVCRRARDPMSNPPQPEAGMLYLILFTYRAPLDVLDRVLPAHRAHLQAHYASGHFLMSGPFFPREGGGILARGESREAIEAIVARDPFVVEQLVEARVIAWAPNRRLDEVPQAWLPEAAASTRTDEDAAARPLS